MENKKTACHKKAARIAWLVSKIEDYQLEIAELQAEIDAYNIWRKASLATWRQDAIQMAKAGATLQEIGTKHGRTRERVRQVLRANGCLDACRRKQREA